MPPAGLTPERLVDAAAGIAGRLTAQQAADSADLRRASLARAVLEGYGAARDDLVHGLGAMFPSWGGLTVHRRQPTDREESQ